MGARPWYKRYGADFVHGTLGLSLEEKGAYSLCLDLIYDRGGPIPDDARWLAGVCNVSVRRWNAIRDRLIDVGKLSCENGCLTNSRAEREIANARKNADERSESGRKGGNKRAEIESLNRKNNGLEQAELKHTRAFQKPDIDIEEPNGSLSETSSDASSKRGKRVQYPPDFESFWKGYPTDKLMSKKEAFAAFRRLGADARTEVLASLPAFRSHCQANPDYRPVHACRYITQERYVGFAELAETAANRVFVAIGTPEWEAWQSVKRTNSMRSTEHGAEGWWFESRWPKQAA